MPINQRTFQHFNIVCVLIGKQQFSFSDELLQRLVSSFSSAKSMNCTDFIQCYDPWSSQNRASHVTNIVQYADDVEIWMNTYVILITVRSKITYEKKTLNINEERYFVWGPFTLKPSVKLVSTGPLRVHE